MPSGLTASIYHEEPTTLRQFILRCARNMGPLVRFKDKSMDWEIPQSVEPGSHYYEELLSNAKQKLAELEGLSELEICIAAKKSHEDKRIQNDEYNENKKTLESRYEEMLEKVKAWEVPKELESLKQLAIDQLVDSCNADCRPFDMSIEPLDAQKWHENRISSLRQNVDRYTKRIENDKKGTVRINAWLKTLHENLKE